MLLQMVMLFLVIVLGYICNKCGVMDADFNRRLTNLVLTICTPAMILDSVLNSEQDFTLGQIGSLLVVSALSYAIGIGMAYLVCWLMRTPVEQAGVIRFMLIFGNVAFIGFPVVRAIFGADAVFYASILNMPFNLLVFTYGVYLMAGGGEGRLTWHEFFSPCIIAAVLALVIALTGVHFPALVGDTTALVGQITTPASLLIIGSNLARLPLRGIFGGPRIWGVALARLLVSPVLLWLVLRGWIADPMLLGVAVLLQGMPVASNCTMVALQYGGDADSAGQGTFVSTLLAVVTIPALAAVLL